MILRNRISALRNPLEAGPENPVQTKQFPATRVGTPPLGTDDAVAAMMRKGHIPGLSVAVVDRDRLRFAAGYGAADRAANTPSTPETSYLWFSMTKVVTATAAVRLADEGRLDLDAPAGEYLPELRGRRDPGPTVRQLLTHTAGLSNPLPLRWTHPMDAPPPDPRSLLSRLLTRRRAFTHPAGRIARYSNVGYLAAGEIISAAAAMPYTEYVLRYVLHPSGCPTPGSGTPPDPRRPPGISGHPGSPTRHSGRCYPTGSPGTGPVHSCR